MESPFLVQYWVCPMCGFETFDLSNKDSHVQLSENDPDHEEIVPIIEDDEVYTFKSNI